MTTMQTRTRRQDRTLELFDRERDLLVSGPLAELPALVARREALLAEVLGAPEPASEEFVHALRSKAERNRRLLLASLAGLGAAREQIEQAEQCARTLRTYTAAGTPVQVSDGAATRDHRR